MPEVYVSAGSNIEPGRHLRLALAVLDRIYKVVRCSPVYRNRAVGFEGHDFFNCVIGFETEHDGESVINELRQVEDECGRDRSLARYGPRSVDLDLLLYGGFVGDLGGLSLPRKEVLEQAYVLRPLADLVPDLTHPVTQRRIQDHWKDFDQQSHVLIEVDLNNDND